MKKLLFTLLILTTFGASAQVQNVEKITCQNPGETTGYVIYPNGFQSLQYPFIKKAVVLQIYQGNLAWENIYKISTSESSNNKQTELHFSNPEMYFQDKTDLWVITKDFKEGYLSQRSFNFCYPGALCEFPSFSKIKCVFE